MDEWIRKAPRRGYCGAESAYRGMLKIMRCTIFVGCMQSSFACVLFEAYKSKHESYAIELISRKLERIVFGIVGDDKDMVVVGTTPYAFDERPLISVEHVSFIPLKEQVAERYALAGYEVAGAVCG